jgi:6-phosphogluconolactonase
VGKIREFVALSGILARTAWAVGLAAILASCGGSSPGYSYTVGGSISGLVGSGLVLQNNAGDDLIVTTNGVFKFSTPIPGGGVYNVTVKTQPNVLPQTCTISNGSGTLGNAPVGGVVVNCVTPPHRFAVDSSGAFAYVSNYYSSGSNNISVYTIDSSSGKLTAGAPVAAGTNPNSVTTVTVDPTHKFAYAANYGSNNVSVYKIDSDGSLIPGTAVTAGTHPISVTIAHPPGKYFAYVANYDSNDISAYTIDSGTGALTAVVGTPVVAAGTNPSAITVDPSGKFAYVPNTSSGTISAYTIDSTTGALAAVAGTPTVPVGTNPSAVTIDPSGKYAYVVGTGSNAISGYAINSTTGVLTPAVVAGAGANPVSVTIVRVDTADPLVKLEFAYVANFNSNSISIYTIDQTTGAFTAQTSAATGTSPISVTVDPSGKFAYAANYGSNNISVYTIDQTTGVLTPGTTVAAGPNPYSISVVRVDTADPLVKLEFAYVTNAGDNSISAYTIDQTTGALIAVP